MRLKCAQTATAVAEYFQRQGKDVLLMMDSLTRFCMAQREIGLATGEAPVARGYTPSIYSALPKLLERSGNFKTGSITGIYTVLVEGDDTNEPIADTVRSIIDGHIILSRKIAAKNHYPAIDVSNSVSRLMSGIAEKDHKDAANQLRNMLKQTKTEDLNLFLSLSKQAEIKEINTEKLLSLGLQVIVPAFVTSELKRGFMIGFLLFLPFMVIDMIVASTLMSMGMVMLPPSMIALPFKLMLFVVVDGWSLVMEMLVKSFQT